MAFPLCLSRLHYSTKDLDSRGGNEANRILLEESCRVCGFSKPPLVVKMKAEIINGDCLEVMPRLIERGVCVDACITDLPYNVGFNYAGSEDDQRVDYKEWCARWFTLARCISPVVAFTPGTVNVAMWCSIAPPDWILAWHKPAAMGNSPFGVCNWEPVLFYGKARRNSGCDVIRAPIVPDRDVAGHPCPKPVEWALGLVRLLTGKGETVLDPFAGTFTVAVACIIEGRKFIGVEQSAEYCAIGEARIKRAQGIPCELPRFNRRERELPLFRESTYES